MVVEVFKPAATAASKVNTAELGGLAPVQGQRSFERPEEQSMATAIPEVLALHSKKYLETKVVVLVVAVMRATPRNEYALIEFE